MKTLKESLQNSLEMINESKVNYSKKIDTSRLGLSGDDVVNAAEYDEFKSIKPSDSVLITSVYNIDFRGLDLEAKLVHFAAEDEIVISNLNAGVDELCVDATDLNDMGYNVKFDNCDIYVKKTLGVRAENFNYDSMFGSSKIVTPYLFVRETDSWGTCGEMITAIQQANEEDCVDHEGSRNFEFEPAIRDYKDLKNKKIDIDLKKEFTNLPKATITIAAITETAPEDGCVVFTKDSSIEKKLAKFDTSDNYGIVSCPRWIKSGELAIPTTIGEIKKAGLDYLLCSGE